MTATPERPDAYLSADEVHAIRRDGLARLGFRSEVVYIGTPVRRWSVGYHLDEDAGPTPPERALQALAGTALSAMDDAVRMARQMLADCDRSGCSVLPHTEHLCAGCRDAKTVLDRYKAEVPSGVWSMTAVTGPSREEG